MGMAGRWVLARGAHIGVRAAAVLAAAVAVAGAAHAAEPSPQSVASCPPAQAEPATPAPAPPSPSMASQPPYAPAPEEIVACVGESPISGATFSHWAAVAERGDSPHGRRGAGPTRAEMMQAMGFLISSDWVFGEAGELGVSVSESEVRRRFDRLRKDQFPRRSAYRAFLRSTGQTNADLLLRVRLSMLSTRIQERVVGRGGGTPRQRARRETRRLTRFVRSFQRKWKARTYCESQFATSDCGHTASVL